MNTALKLKPNEHKIIYGMPSEEYHALQRFSASGIKKLLVSAQDFWTSSWMNPDRYESKSDAFQLGTAYHTRILEGARIFNQRYAVAPVCDKRTTAGKQVYAEWLSKNSTAEPIDERVYKEINNAAANTCPLFSGGKSEVTILWDDDITGVPMKARLDYIKSGIIPDLKTFSNPNGTSIDRLIANHIVKYRYHVQAAIYNEALPDHEFFFVFQQTGQENNCIVKRFPSDLLLADQGRKLARFGIDKFADMYRKFGTKPWVDEFNNDPFTDDSFPLYALED